MRSPRHVGTAAVLAAVALSACSPVHPAAKESGGSPSATPDLTASAGTVTPFPTPSASGSHPPGAPLHDLVIVVDPGHNGGNGSHVSRIRRPVDAGGLRKPCNTTGTETNAGYPEHAFTWDVAKRLTALLRHDGATVVLTRHSDNGVGPCVDDRGKAAVRRHADLLLSIHADGAASSAHGFTVLRPGRVPGYTTRTCGPSKKFGADLADAMVAHGLHRSTYLGSHGMEIRRDLGTLNLASVPAVMVEAGNMRNAGDARMLSAAKGRQRVAVGLAAGVLAYEHHR